MIGKSRLSKYTVADGDLLVLFVGQFRRIWTTHHVLAETSNLASQMLYSNWKTEFFGSVFPMFCGIDHPSFLRVAPDYAQIRRPIFVALGMTDASLVADSAKKLLLTDDMDVHIAAMTGGGTSINFTHLREAAGTLQ